jgi:hypothetical protein
MADTTSMNTYRTTAIFVGIFFIFAIVVLFIGPAMYSPILTSPDVLDTAYPNRSAVILGVLIELIGYIGLILIPILLFPVLKKHAEFLARAYVGFRLFEVMILTMAQTGKLALIGVSEAFLQAGAGDAAAFEAIAVSIQSACYWLDSGGMIYLIVFNLGAMFFYTALYRSKLVPRFLSVWGFLSAANMLIGRVLIELGVFAGMSEAVLQLIFAMPLALNEITLSIWLIVKGFDRAALGE